MKNELSTTLPSETGATLLPRRQFLVLGSAAVAAAAASSLSADIVRGALVTEDTAPRISVGFAAAPLDAFSQPDFSRRLTSASKLRAGDSAMANGVRLRILGLSRAEAGKNEPISMAMDAMYRVAGQEVPFLAWSHAQKGGFAHVSAPSNHVVPVSAKQPLTLAVSSATGANAPTLRATVNLAVDDRRRTNKLRRGLYFVAMCPAGSQTPDWTSVHAVPSADGKLPVLKQATLAGLTPVSFDYVIVSTDIA